MLLLTDDADGGDGDDASRKQEFVEGSLFLFVPLSGRLCRAGSKTPPCLPYHITHSPLDRDAYDVEVEMVQWRCSRGIVEGLTMQTLRSPS